MRRFAVVCSRWIVSVAHEGPSEGPREALKRCEASFDSSIEIVCDPLEDQSPLAGVAAALEMMRAPQALYVAIDMPNVRLELAGALSRPAHQTSASEPPALGAVPRWSGRLEPAFGGLLEAPLAPREAPH